MCSILYMSPSLMSPKMVSSIVHVCHVSRVRFVLVEALGCKMSANRLGFTVTTAKAKQNYYGRCEIGYRLPFLIMPYR